MADSAIAREGAPVVPATLLLIASFVFSSPSASSLVSLLVLPPHARRPITVPRAALRRVCAVISTPASLYTLVIAALTLTSPPATFNTRPVRYILPPAPTQ
ncbi:hypothetical protein L226DRAFT_354134 [Lentinus tigrinus ALCF2SS1-7]|uniref:uncharacterized protein n=1 Tax=Lentinus tigrinus ALCF2SS1-7 TaxID=1328758 RepID=UPI0011661BA7|nr:hypothetical protein L226DRAFT_354134 [Lentinus tigrinus ALCF2SS1-7]